MASKNGQLVRLYDDTSVTIENVVSGSSIIAGIQLPGLGLNEQDWVTWSSTDISSTTIVSANVKRKTIYPNLHDALEINNGNLVVS